MANLRPSIPPDQPPSSLQTAATHTHRKSAKDASDQSSGRRCCMIGGRKKAKETRKTLFYAHSLNRLCKDGRGFLRSRMKAQLLMRVYLMCGLDGEFC